MRSGSGIWHFFTSTSLIVNQRPLPQSFASMLCITTSACTMYIVNFSKNFSIFGNKVQWLCIMNPQYDLLLFIQLNMSKYGLCVRLGIGRSLCSLYYPHLMALWRNSTGQYRDIVFIIAVFPTARNDYCLTKSTWTFHCEVPDELKRLLHEWQTALCTYAYNKHVSLQNKSCWRKMFSSLCTRRG